MDILKMINSLVSIRNVAHKLKANVPLLKRNPAEWLAELATHPSELQVQRSSYNGQLIGQSNTSKY
jgi:hypothetical protein